jgi:hypothetical protein
MPTQILLPEPDSLVVPECLPVAIYSSNATQVYCLRILDEAGNPISGIIQRQTANHYLIEQIKFMLGSEPTRGYLQVCEPLDGVNCNSGLINCHSIPISFCYPNMGKSAPRPEAPFSPSPGRTRPATSKTKPKSAATKKTKPARQTPKPKPKPKRRRK